MAKNPNLIRPDGDLSESELKFGYFFVKNKLLFKKIFIGLFILFDVLLIVNAGYGYIKHYFIEPINQSEFKEAEISQSQPPQEIKAIGSEIISLGDDRYDLLVQVSNPNENFVVRFEYYFAFAGGKTENKEGFILPGETKYLAELGFDSTRRPTSISLQFENLNWQRINRHEIPDYTDYYEKHFNFEVTDTVFRSAQDLGLDTISKAMFTIQNNTAYNFWNVNVYVVLYRGNKIVGVNRVVLDQFLTRETRDVEAAFYESLPLVNKVEIIPEVDILDDFVYMEMRSDG